MKADPGGWYARVEHNHDTVTAVLQHTLVDRHEPFGVHAAGHLTAYWYYRNRVLDGDRFMRAALDQPGADPADRALTQLALAYSHAFLDRAALAAPLIRAVLVQARRLPQQALVHGLVSAAWGASIRRDTALDFVRDTVRQLAEDGDPYVVVSCDLLDAMASYHTHGPAEAAAGAAEVMDRAGAQGNVVIAWLACWLGVFCALALGDPDTGRTLLHRAERHHRELGGTASSSTLEFEADFAALAGDDRRAVRLFSRARTRAFHAGTHWPISPATGTMLAQVRRRLSAQEYEAAWREGSDTASSP